MELLKPWELVLTHAVTSYNRVRRLAMSISADGMKNAIKYVEHDGHKYVVDGHHRIAAAKRAGLQEVPAEEVKLPYGQYKSPKDLTYDPGY
jgi:ParB-like chromosome segregation protein Spo0J